ncbi:unnamed protein product [Protopolystoma xenopodis]|uniref:Uncharacterized protein n=1 Tax=Protopolystoma xenopodis TaxID=117903 RepID=A0A448X878_9PLAT|nr:unnamed protein product [Protopolystoma xenopodis]VEL31076.1 unnamed protein product [Protopolystoma xenopodis]
MAPSHPLFHYIHQAVADRQHLLLTALRLFAPINCPFHPLAIKSAFHTRFSAPKSLNFDDRTMKSDGGVSRSLEYDILSNTEAHSAYPSSFLKPDKSLNASENIMAALQECSGGQAMNPHRELLSKNLESTQPNWEVVARDGEMTLYKREIESADGTVLDPLQVCGLNNSL